MIMCLQPLNSSQLATLLAPWRTWSQGVALAFATWAGCAPLAQAQSQVQAMDRIKAAYVYNFAKFVDLPVVDNMPIRLCLVGKDDPNGRMASLHRRTAQKREIHVFKDTPLDQLKDCAMVFVGYSEARQFPNVVRQLGNAPILLISDVRLAIDQGAHLVLLHHDDRVEFEVNLLNLQKSNLRASSQMLKLARTVVR